MAKGGAESTKIVSERLILVITVLLAFLMSARTPLDSDMWWHLRAGQATIESGKPLTMDIFSYTREGEPWINHSWLSQVVLFGLFHQAGFRGLAAWVSLLTAVCLVLLLQSMRGAAWWRALLLILTVVTMAPVLSPRPQVMSLVMFSGLNWLLWTWRTGKVRHAWLLPILFLAWSNFHGGYSLGFLLLAAFLGGQVINRLVCPAEALPWKTLGIIAIWCGLAFLAVAVNPNGMAMWKIPFQTVGVESLQQFILEWASPDFHDINQQPVLLVLILLIGALGFSGRKWNGVDFLTCGGFLVLALVSRRNIAPFALAAMPVISRQGWDVVEEIGEKGKAWIQLPAILKPGQVSRAHPWINLLLAALVGFAAFAKLGVVSLPEAVESASRGLFPQAAVEWLRQNPSQDRLLSEYAWGGYLDWYLPEGKVFVDGRTDLFGDEIISEWRQVVQADDEMKDILDHWNVDRVLLMPKRPAVSELIKMGWVTLYEDATSVLLEWPEP